MRCIALILFALALGAHAATTNILITIGPYPKYKDMSKAKTNGPSHILSAEQRSALSRITSRGFITNQKTLKDGRKELTWTDGKNTIVTTQAVTRVNGGKARDPRRAQIESIKAERDTAKADRAAIKAERDTLKSENTKLKKEKAK